MTRKALYLAGGGARGAYQAGCLQALSHILRVKKIPFDTISGISVGCLNAAVLTENAMDFQAGTDKLVGLWQDIHSDQIFHASNYELSKSLLRNLSNMFVLQNNTGYLLNTKPLFHFISKAIDFEQLDHHLKKGHLKTLEVISNCYDTQQCISFYQHYGQEFEDWDYPRHKSRRVVISTEHILASCALPLFFPPAHIDGLHYGDGSLGLLSPLRGPIRFNVDKIMIIGNKPRPTFSDSKTLRSGHIGVARVLGGMLTNLLVDNLERDIEMVNRMNEIAGMISIWKKKRSPWRPIETYHLRPSQDIGTIAQAQYNHIPVFLRFVLNTLGAKSYSGDLLSFLLFEQGFTRELLKLGFDDTLAAKEAVIRFFQE